VERHLLELNPLIAGVELKATGKTNKDLFIQDNKTESSFTTNFLNTAEVKKMESTKIIPFHLSVSKWKPPPQEEQKVELFKPIEVPKQI